MESIYQSQANAFGYAAIVLWILVSLYLFTIVSPQKAALATMLSGTLFLPERIGFDFPLVPPMTKHTLPASIAMLGVAWRRPGLLRSAKLTNALPFPLALPIWRIV